MELFHQVIQDGVLALQVGLDHAVQLELDGITDQEVLFGLAALHHDLDQRTKFLPNESGRYLSGQVAMTTHEILDVGFQQQKQRRSMSADELDKLPEVHALELGAQLSDGQGDSSELDLLGKADDHKFES